jgi:predicted nuclease of predicted toxin-antitoxin system
MRILIDMNLSPDWVQVLQKHGHVCVHWSGVGSPQAPDGTVMEFADRNGYVLLTHDLDFGAILAATGASGPSVIQIRTQDIFPSAMEPLLVSVLQRFEQELTEGALIVVEEARSRVRILRLRRRSV